MSHPVNQSTPRFPSATSASRRSEAVPEVVDLASSPPLSHSSPPDSVVPSMDRSHSFHEVEPRGVDSQDPVPMDVAQPESQRGAGGQRHCLRYGRFYIWLDDLLDEVPWNTFYIW